MQASLTWLQMESLDFKNPNLFSCSKRQVSGNRMYCEDARGSVITVISNYQTLQKSRKSYTTRPPETNRKHCTFGPDHAFPLCDLATRSVSARFAVCVSAAFHDASCLHPLRLFCSSNCFSCLIASVSF